MVCHNICLSEVSSRVDLMLGKAESMQAAHLILNELTRALFTAHLVCGQASKEWCSSSLYALCCLETCVSCAGMMVVVMWMMGLVIHSP